ncbi:MAG: hypothetical protein IT435_11585 [Phycisphaerales bacterium]|nr:hypothetical protein [Phycisphaerales bacterium]
MKNTIAALALLATMAPAALAQLPANGGFEDVDEFFGDVIGWVNFTNEGELYRRVGDGLGPILVRTGVACIELASGNNFAGFTTDVVNPETGDFNNPPVEFIETPSGGLAGGDCVVTGWYAIPADQPLKNVNSGIKLEFRRPNNGIFHAFEALTINGHTNGQFVQFEMTVTRAQIADLWLQYPPAPWKVSVLPLRFGTFAATGTIFWDDIEFFQYCIGDFDKSRFVDTDDFDAFVHAFEAGEDSADVDGSGFVDTDDFDFFVGRFQAGC